MNEKLKIAGGLVLLAALAIANLFFGSIHLPAAEVWAALTGGASQSETSTFIVLQSRLPQMITAVLAGASLAVAGLLLQTLFNNPLADPSILGLNAGAGLGVAVVLLALGGGVTVGTLTLSGFLLVVAAAFVGAFLVLLLLLACASLLRSNLLLLIVGVMVGYLTSALVSLLNFSATEQGVHSYIIWGMGDFSSVTLDRLPAMSGCIVVLLTASLLLMKPLNALLLGKNYAKNLGVNVNGVRKLILVITGGLSAVVTALCGPIGFIGLAVPHMVRMVFRTSDHRRLLPLTLMVGAATALACNLICHLASNALPLNSITSIVGVPVVLYVIFRHRRAWA